MNQAEKACRELQAMDQLAAQDSFVHRLSPGSKLLLTVCYIVITISFSKYDIFGLFFMIFYPIIAYQLAQIPIRTCFHKLRVVLPLVCAVGLLNPLFDREILMTLGPVRLSGGVISMLTLMMKGVFSLMASFLLIATTPIEAICAALRKIHVSKILTSLLLLTYRYVAVLLEEVSVMTQAYHLRAPGQKGIHFSAWGSFLGQLLLRSMDRATALYESMELRGFHGEFYYAQLQAASPYSWPYALAWIGILLLGRWVNIPAFLGGLMV